MRGRGPALRGGGPRRARRRRCADGHDRTGIVHDARRASRARHVGRARESAGDHTSHEVSMSSGTPSAERPPQGGAEGDVGRRASSHARRRLRLAWPRPASPAVARADLGPAPPTPRPAGPRHGRDRRPPTEIVGWVAVPTAGSPAIRVSLHLHGVEVAATSATDGPRRAQQLGRGARRSGSSSATCWLYARKTDKLVVRADGKALPILGRGMFVKPAARRAHDVLRCGALADGHVFSATGKLQLSKKPRHRSGRARSSGCTTRSGRSSRRPTATTSSSCTAPCSAPSARAGSSATTSTSTRRSSPGTSRARTRRRR